MSSEGKGNDQLQDLASKRYLAEDVQRTPSWCTLPILIPW